MIASETRSRRWSFLLCRIAIRFADVMSVGTGRKGIGAGYTTYFVRSNLV